MTRVQLRLLLMTAKLVRRVVGVLAEDHFFNHVQLDVTNKKFNEAINDVEKEAKHEQRG